jgi:hypothetical protein
LAIDGCTPPTLKPVVVYESPLAWISSILKDPEIFIQSEEVSDA